MQRVYFVRHGEGQDNVARQFSYKRVDRPLTERGRMQAQQTGRHLAGRGIEGIFCSPMKRAHETAQIIAAQLGLQPVVLEEFREVNVGDLEGKDFNAETWRVYHRAASAWIAGDTQAAMPGGEDYNSLWGRTRRGFLRMLAGGSNRTLVLVGHAGIFSATLKDLCPGPDPNWLLTAQYYNCAITELEIDAAGGELRGRLVEWASYAHLGEEVLTRMPGIPPIE